MNSCVRRHPPLYKKSRNVATPAPCLETIASPAVCIVSETSRIMTITTHLFASWLTVIILVVSPGLMFCHGWGLDLVQMTNEYISKVLRGRAK